MGMESPKRILGIEGGGTKTNWVLLNGGGAVLREGVLSASNLQLISDEALTSLLSVLPRDATHVGAFLAGCGTADDRARLHRLVEKIWPDAQLAIGSDRDSGLATAFRDGDGIAVIAGTGAAVHGRKGERIEKAGGWGQLLGDRGSGYDVARRGLREVLTHFDLNHQITPVAEEILRTLSLNRLQDLVGWAMQADKMSVARLAPAVFNAAKFGDRQMVEIIESGAQVLAEFTQAVAQRLEFPDAPVRLIGGMFTNHEEYAALYRYRLSQLVPKATVEVCAESGALGAAWLAEHIPSAPPPRETTVASDADALATAATEQSNPRSTDLEKQTTAQLVELFISEEPKITEALSAQREELVDAVDLVSTALTAKGRLFYVGAGTSGRLGVLDASEIPPTFGAPPELVQGIIAGGVTALHRAVEGAEDQPEAGALAMLERGVCQRDVVCGISASGRAPFVVGALERARFLGARTILLTCNPQRTKTHWDVEIDLPTGPEIVTGSTRLKAGTATKVVLNILSTCAMVRLGRVRGNAMVDLHISNAKLRDRGVRLVSRELKISYEEAMARLEHAGWNVRAALR
ncbi:glucokinase regulatory-like protein [Chthoniobacter flavus Ellin428]|uniref:Glucokinase regulatory-like protein n=2 Tax=Chthoniobacter flavus TaxID=191863 RepID=B4DB58_9BACT|nr:glucokinase regulatory-like protein [Chthoniobacter flavus Ellin428]TCO90248.1 N-acetylmuramic acid 6-phosphate etherase [Chthoniobacter flavus]